MAAAADAWGHQETRDSILFGMRLKLYTIEEVVYIYI